MMTEGGAEIRDRIDYNGGTISHCAFPIIEPLRNQGLCLRFTFEHATKRPDGSASVPGNEGHLAVRHLFAEHVQYVRIQESLARGNAKQRSLKTRACLIVRR